MQSHAGSRIRFTILGLTVLLMTVPLSAQGADPPPPALVARPALMDFGDVARDEYMYSYFQVTNTSDHPVTISGFSQTIPYAMDLYVDNGCRGIRNPGTTCGINVAGYVLRTGEHIASLRILSDDPHSPLVMHVRAVIPDAGPPVITHGPQHQEMRRAFKPPKRQARYRWSWAATDDWRVTGFTTQRRIGTGRWQTLVSPSRPVTDGESQSVPITLPTGKVVTLRTRAHDPSGKTSVWAKRTVKIGYRDIRLGKSLKGKWKDVKARGAYGGSNVVTRQDGAVASITARAQSIALLGRKGPGQGSIDYEYTNGDPANARLNASRNKDLQVIATWTWEGVATRTVSVEAKTGWGRQVSLDAWVVMQ